MSTLSSLVDQLARWARHVRTFTYALLATWCLAFVFVWSRLLFQDDLGLHARSVNIWGDWIVHITYVNVFSDWSISQWLDRSPLLILDNFRYPPAPNYFSSLFVRVGLGTYPAMQLTSGLLCVGLVIALYRFFRDCGFERLWAVAGLTLFLLNGGAGFIDVIFDGAKSATHLPQEGIVVQNFIVSEFIPQRAIQFAAPFFVCALIVLMRSTRDGPLLPQRLKWTALMTLLSVLVLLSSMHTFLSLVVVSAIFAAFNWRHWKLWLLMGAVAGLVTSSIYVLYYGANDLTHFLKWAPLELVTFSKLSVVDHFYRNYGIVLVLAIYSIYRFDLWKQPFSLAALVLLALSYSIQFQPWIWDNTKILTWFYLLIIPSVLILLRHWWGTHLRKRLAAVVVLFLATAAGAHDVALLLRPDAPRFQMLTAEDHALAASFKAMTTPEDRVFTHIGHANWVHTLAARQVVKAFGGWLWTYGLETSAVDAMIERALAGDFQPLRDHDVEYLVIDRHHEAPRVRFPANHPELEPILASPRYAVYRLRAI